MEDVPSVARPALVVPGRMVLWGAAAVLFIGLRFGPVFQAPVGGSELVHLSGAWEAREGAAGDRFVPTLFQAIAALSLRFTESEFPARALAFLATATVPVALFALRGRLGEAGALLALLLLAVDAPSIALGATATAMGFDLALTAWLFVAIGRPGLPRWAWPVLAALLTMSGPVAVPLVVAAGGLMLYEKRDIPGRRVAEIAGGVAAGLLLTNLRFGLGFDGFRAPPLLLFSQSFEEVWSTATGFRLGLLYDLALLAGGLAAVAFEGYRASRSGSLEPHRRVLLAWAMAALAWYVVAGSSHSPVALAAVVVPLALVLGPVLAEAVTPMLHADWRWPRLVLPVAALAVAMALGSMLDWARLDRFPDSAETYRVALLLIGAAISTVAFAANPATRPTLLAPALGLALLVTLPGTWGVTLSQVEEPLPSPVSPYQARELHAIAVDLAASRGGGPILVHERLAPQAAWPFRGAGDVRVVSEPLEGAAVLIWPLDAPPPDGYSVLEGEWALQREVLPPQGFLKVLRWFSDRNSLAISSQPVAVYTAGEP